eukprot:TRINITY_DN69_c0_g2_i2.p1 TRINITY_DN69_c0_g2~~TRINITY_DN69_c0_g2_i2.p1  ORF type:complete len:473 (-),score=115.29 TRINITY_DN69_c0_g2_i2:60-1283(-)
MADAFSQGVQLIVFPEYGLTGAAFNSRDEILPYLEEIPATGGYISLLNESAALQRASALAAQYQMYMVLDLGEIEYCTAQTENCPDDGRFQYNTAVVFDNAGKLVTKYRKTHLYYEDYFNPGPGMPVFFEFRNTRIGLLICFDLQFRKPQYDLYAAGVNVLAFPTWWENSKPFTAPQIQQSSTFVHDTVLMAANAGNGCKNSGSGFYRSGAVLDYFFNPAPVNHDTLLVTDITAPAKMGATRQRPAPAVTNTCPMLPLAKVGSHTMFTSVPGATVTAQASWFKFSCTASLHTTANSKPQAYTLVAYSGPYPAVTSDMSAQLCAVIACRNPNCSGQRWDDPMPEADVDNLVVHGSYKDNVMMYPQLSTAWLGLYPDLEPLISVNGTAVWTNDGAVLERLAVMLLMGIM